MAYGVAHLITDVALEDQLIELVGEPNEFGETFNSDNGVSVHFKRDDGQESRVTRGASKSTRSGYTASSCGHAHERGTRSQPRSRYRDGVRVALVSPYRSDGVASAAAHVRVFAAALARLGPEVVVLAPAHSPALLRDGRVRLRRLANGDSSSLRPEPGEPLLVAVGYGVDLRPSAHSLPISVAARASIAVALSDGRFDVVELIDPDLLGSSATVIRRAPAPLVATFTRPPVFPWSRLRERAVAIRGQTSETVAALGGEAVLTGVAVDPAFAPGVERHPPVVVVDCGLSDAQMLRALAGELALSDVTMRLLGTKPLRVAQLVATGALARSVSAVHDPNSVDVRSRLLGSASVLVAGEGGSVDVAAQALASGLPVLATASAPAAALVRHGKTGFVATSDQPELVAAYAGRLLGDAEERRRIGQTAATGAESADAFAARALRVYTSVVGPAPAPEDPTVQRILCDFHMHTAHSADSATSVAELVQHAIDIGLGAIAVTDHNSIAGGLEARRYVEERGLPLHVIVGSEVKTATGEVIGLYLREDIPRGQPFTDTIAAIREQGAVVYVPHPFDRRHAIPDADLLARLADELDVIEVANGRLLREAYNDDALAFAERYALLQGAGSDEHVIEGLGSAVVDLPSFSDPETLLAALAHGRIVRRPTGFYRLQALKLARQARKRLHAR